MPKQCMVHGYSIVSEGGTAADIEKLIRKFANQKKPLQFRFNEIPYCIGEAALRRRGKDEIFTATVFRLRSTDLPSMIETAGVRPLELGEDTHLGEDMVLRLRPLPQKAFTGRG